MLAAITVRASLGQLEVAVTPPEAARMPARRLALRPGQPVLVEQALQALMIVSANDVAVVLADRAAGSRHRFGLAMNAQSRRLGLRSSPEHVPGVRVDQDAHLAGHLGPRRPGRHRSRRRGRHGRGGQGEQGEQAEACAHTSLSGRRAAEGPESRIPPGSRQAADLAMKPS